MKYRLAAWIAAVALLPPSAHAQVEKVRADSKDALALPEDLFRLPPGAWLFAKHLWEGDAPCTADACEAGYTSGDLVVSVERVKSDVRIIAGFRNCTSVAWNFHDVGKEVSKSDTKTIAKRINKAVGTSAKYCKVQAQAVPELDARQLYPPQPQQAP